MADYLNHQPVNGKGYQLNLAITSAVFVGLILLFYFKITPYLFKHSPAIALPRTAIINTHLFWLLFLACPFFILLNFYFGLVESHLKKEEEFLFNQVSIRNAAPRLEKELLAIRHHRKGLIAKTELLLTLAMGLVMIVLAVDFWPWIAALIKNTPMPYF